MHTEPPQDLFAIRPTLHGELCSLRPFTSDDIAVMAHILADPEVNRLTGSVRSTAEAEGRSPELDDRTRSWYESRNRQTDRLDLAILDRATGNCVGEAVLNEWRPADGIVNFRILIGPAGRNRGLGSEATGLITNYCFRSTTINRIELEVYAFNPRAQRVYEKSGFIAEGRLRQVLKFDGGYIDAIPMSMLRSDWRTRTDRTAAG
jgi:RimJ/RimL family protein N-acetyltransferase